MRSGAQRSRSCVAWCVVVVVVATLAGCSDDSAPRSQPATTSDASSLEGSGYADAPSLPSSNEPKIRAPSGPPPRRLLVRDLIKGTGPPLERGDRATVNYVGFLYSSGRKYDTSYGRNGLALDVVVGRDNFIDGFVKGLIGMRLGGRRELTIPAHLAYGRQGYPPDVGPNEALIFVVDVDDVR